MRILQLKTSASCGGAETLILQITHALLAQGHAVHTVLGEKGWLETQMRENAQPVECLPLTSLQNFLQIPRLVKIIRKHQSQVVLSHGARVNLVGAIAAHISDVPSISVEHNIDDWRSSWMMNSIDRKVASLNIHRIAVSSAVKTTLTQLRILPAEKISVIPNGVAFPQEKMSAAQRQLIRRRFGFSDTDFVLCTTARLVEQKGHCHLIHIIPHLQQNFSHIRFLFLGEGPLRSMLENQVASLGVTNQVHFAGAVDGVMSLLPAFDGFVLPSLWEGMPIALIEAMGMGLPVIATRVAGTPEVVTDGATGLLVPPADSAALLGVIRYLYTDSKMRVTLAERGQAYARDNHSLEKVVKRYLTILESISR